jgi:hypothetical protein
MNTPLKLTHNTISGNYELFAGTIFIDYNQHYPLQPPFTPNIINSIIRDNNTRPIWGSVNYLTGSLNKKFDIGFSVCEWPLTITPPPAPPYPEINNITGPIYDFLPGFVSPRTPQQAPTDLGNYNLNQYSLSQCRAQSSPIIVDISGTQFRPCPTGSDPDIGAYEICSSSTPIPIITQNDKLEQPIDNFSEKSTFELTITPNPSNGKFIIYYNFSDSLSSVYLSVLNTQGIKIKDIKLPYKQYLMHVDVSEFAKGIYFLQVQTVNGILTRKVIIN